MSAHGGSLAPTYAECEEVMRALEAFKTDRPVLAWSILDGIGANALPAALTLLQQAIDHMAASR